MLTSSTAPAAFPKFRFGTNGMILRPVKFSVSVGRFTSCLGIPAAWGCTYRRLSSFPVIEPDNLCSPMLALGSGVEGLTTDRKKNDLSLDNVNIVVESRDEDKIHVRVDLTGEQTQRAFDFVLTNLARTAPPVPGFRRRKGGKTSTEKSAFIFCVDDRALFCQDCDEAIHIPATRTANHQRLLATGIRVGSSPQQNTNTVNPLPELPKSNFLTQAPKLPDKIQTPSPSVLSPWEVDDFLHLPDHESSDKEALIGFGELLWFSDIGAAEVPEMFFQQASNEVLNSPPSSKKPKFQMLGDEDFFTVPNLG